MIRPASNCRAWRHGGRAAAWHGDCCQPRYCQAESQDEQHRTRGPIHAGTSIDPCDGRVLHRRPRRRHPGRRSRRRRVARLRLRGVFSGGQAALPGRAAIDPGAPQSHQRGRGARHGAGGCRQSPANVAVANTGVTDATDDRIAPGTQCYAWVFKQGGADAHPVIYTATRQFSGSRNRIRQASAEFALQGIVDCFLRHRPAAAG